MDNGNLSKSIPAEVDTAFEILLEEIENVANAYTEEGSCALHARDFAKARQMTDRAELIANFRQKVDGIRREWAGLDILPYLLPAKPEAFVVASLSRLARGARTPESAYYAPILLSLVEAGGSCPVVDVLESVLGRMKGILKDVDFEPMGTNGGEPRWRNTARWARNAMVQDGRLKQGVPRGVWEISAEGLQWLESVVDGSGQGQSP
jgi:hypothetical protein